MKYTDEQIAVLDADNCSMLVSAAAGSGKTTVMVQRLINLVLSGKARLSRVLACTFTRAAASSMKEKIETEINRRISEGDTREELFTALAELPSAAVCTYDSFCADIVRRYYYLLDINADFSVADSDRHNEICDAALKETLECAAQLAEDGEFPEFAAFFPVYAPGKKYTSLAAGIKALAAFVRSFPHPEEKLSSLTDALSLPVFENELIKKGTLDLECAEEYINMLYSELEFCNPAVRQNYLECLESDRAALCLLRSAHSLKDGAADIGRKKNNPSKGKADPDFSLSFNPLRDTEWGIIKNVSAFYRSFDTSPDPRPRLEFFVRLTRIYLEKREALLKKFNLLYFSDITLLAVKAADISEVRAELSFDCIFVDEFQDTDYIQDYLVTLLSGGKNLFLVGDIKQSIYLFRGTVPQLFLDKARQFNTPDERLMHLRYNFRSDSGVIDGVNLLFSNLLSERMFEIEYDADAALHLPPDKPADNAAACELMVLTYTKEEKKAFGFDDVTAIDAEAARVAEKIRRLLETTITGADGTVRPVRYGDIVLLSRTGSGVSERYERVFRREGIPFFRLDSGGFAGAWEVGVLKALLRLLCSRRSDISLATVMVGMFGFTQRRLGEIRAGKKCSFLDCLLTCPDDDVKSFLLQLDEWRFLQSAMPLERFLVKVCRETGFTAYCAALPGGEVRLKNLRTVFLAARSQATCAGMPLRRFLEYLDRLERSEDNSGIIPDDSINAVRFITMHKSKGLEFPIVIAVNCGAGRRHSSDKCCITTHRALGAAPSLFDLTDAKQSDIYNGAIKQRRIFEENAELLRVLYVACTRAVRRLIICGSVDAETGSENLLLTMWNRRNASSFLDWVMPVIAAHRDGAALRLAFGTDAEPTLTQSRWQVSVSPLFAPVSDAAVTIPSLLECISRGAAGAEAAGRNMSFDYPYRQATLIRSKGTAPHTLSPQENEAALLGTAYHTLLEFYDFTASPAQTLKKLTDLNYIAPREAEKIDLSKIERLAASPLGRELASCKTVREAPFTIAEHENGEEYLRQGIIDCYYIKDGSAVLVDFKSDRVTDRDALVRRYTPQLQRYVRALKECFSLDCSRAVIFFLDTGEAVDVLQPSF